MAENLMTKVWALDFAAHVWTVEGSNEPQRFTSANVKYVCLAIARASLGSGACWASQKTLAQVTGVSKQTVGRAVTELESAGWLRRLGRAREDGGKSTDKLWLTLPEVVLAAETVPARPLRFLPGAAEDPDHDGTPTITVEGQVPPPRGAPPITVIGQEGESEREGKKGSTPPDDIKGAVELIWARASKRGRERSSKPEIEAGLRAALARGWTMEQVLRGLAGYFASEDATKEGGAFQRGPHVMLASDRFASFLEDAHRPGPATEGQEHAHQITGTLEEPSEELQRTWMTLWAQGMPWNPERGPAPERPGCRVVDSIQREHGATPYGAGAATDDAGAFD